jgi:hypothetical protein
MDYHCAVCLDGCPSIDSSGLREKLIPDHLKSPIMWAEWDRIEGCPRPKNLDWEYHDTQNPVNNLVREPGYLHFGDEDMQTLPELIANAKCLPCTLSQGQAIVGWQFGAINSEAAHVIEQVTEVPMKCSVANCNARASYWGFRHPLGPRVSFKRNPTDTTDTQNEPWPTRITTWQEFNLNSQVIAMMNRFSGRIPLRN